jgi:D-ribose pyranose/furanose isomerase RbsD
MKKIWILILFFSVILVGCINNVGEVKVKSNDWKETLKDQLSYYGHRNWILVVDKAFPSQNANGIITINTDEGLLNVLQYTLGQIDSAAHVQPVIFTDKELNYITSDQVPEIENYKKSLANLIGKSEPQVLLHDSVFVKIDQASKLFSVMILKTNEVIPYSSVFIQLDCKYWTPEQEKQLRENMKK